LLADSTSSTPDRKPLLDLVLRSGSHQGSTRPLALRTSISFPGGDHPAGSASREPLEFVAVGFVNPGRGPECGPRLARMVTPCPAGARRLQLDELGPSRMVSNASGRASSGSVAGKLLVAHVFDGSGSGARFRGTFISRTPPTLAGAPALGRRPRHGRVARSC